MLWKSRKIEIVQEPNPIPKGVSLEITADTILEIKLDRNIIDSNVIIIHEGPYSPAYDNFPKW